MHDALRREIVRCERTGHRLSLVLVDMDDFKQVNEEHGHLVGDEVLRRVGHALRQAVRPYDLVARYGGDEFAVVTIDADEEEAAEVAGRALDGVAPVAGRPERRAGRHRRQRRRGRVAARARAATELIEAADRALLYGKQEGERGEVTTRLPEGYRPGRSGRKRGPPAGARARARCRRRRRRGRGVARPRPRADRAPAQAHPAARDGQRAGHAPGRR